MTILSLSDRLFVARLLRLAADRNDRAARNTTDAVRAYSLECEAARARDIAGWLADPPGTDGVRTP